MQIPYEDQVQQFFAEVDDFCAENEDDKLLGVHSTFGGNRSGIFFPKASGSGNLVTNIPVGLVEENFKKSELFWLLIFLFVEDRIINFLGLDSSSVAT